ncbi:MAG: hypothetical protein JWQ30_170 [Sediminibacterium sp.]|nr:hypothetical protein [Sediminibacterium sp.]
MYTCYCISSVKSSRMKRQTLLLFFVLSVFYGSGQRLLVTCSTERNSDNSVSIYADAQISGEYTLKITFTEFSGFTCSLMSTYRSGNTEIGLTTIFKGRREIAKLTPIKSASTYALNYKYTYYPGITVRRVPDSNFVYLLPGSPGNRLRISRVSYIGDRLGQKSQDNFSAIGFVYKLGDTICASRAGTIYDCSDEIKEGEKGTEWYKRDRNRISIQQKDGTLANYSIVSPIQLLVAAGDYVVPGQPLAVFNKESEKYHVFFSVYYLDEKKILVDNANSNAEKLPNAYTYISTAFYLDQADRADSPARLEINKQYIAAHPKEIIATELSKKDKKKLGL